MKSYSIKLIELIEKDIESTGSEFEDLKINLYKFSDIL